MKRYMIFPALKKMIDRPRLNPAGPALRAVLLVILLAVLNSCQDRMDKEAALIVKNMTVEQKIGQMLLVGVPGNSISGESSGIIAKYMPGSIIFFGYNIAGAAELKKFIGDLQAASLEASGIPMFVSIDQEGGRVYRITDGVTQFPGNMAFGAAGETGLVRDSARILGIQLRSLGVNMNLAPVLDVNNNPRNPVINTRSFGSDSGRVREMGVAYIKGIQKSMCIAVGKHFPGHGDTDKDSHITLPVISYDIKRLEQVEFPPFRAAIDAGVECIMTAHIAFPNIMGNDLPATVSKKFLSEILRDSMGFRGIVITDALEMDAISGMMDMGEAAVRSIEAGTDIVLISGYGEGIEKVYSAVKKAIAEGRLAITRLDDSVKRIIELKLRYKIMDYDKGKIVHADVAYSSDELSILKKADEINAAASRKAIYLYRGAGPGLVLFNNKNYTKFLISCNLLLIDEIKKYDDSRTFGDEKSFLEFLKSPDAANWKKNSGGRGIVLYYESGKIDPAMIDRVCRAGADAGIIVNLLATGNPFPIGGAAVIPASLLTFSNSTESVRQMIACLNGDFRPREKIDISLGFDKKYDNTSRK